MNYVTRLKHWVIFCEVGLIQKCLVVKIPGAEAFLGPTQAIHLLEEARHPPPTVRKDALNQHHLK